MRVTAKEDGISLWGDETVLELDSCVDCIIFYPLWIVFQ